MSIEPQVLGTSTVVGGGAGAASMLADTGNPVIIGLAVGLGLIIILGVITRLAQTKQSEQK